MKKITQTGIIPIESIGTLFGNYLKFFKVYFVFYMIPFVSILAALYFTCKEQIMLLIQNIFQYVMLSKMAAGNEVLMKAADEALEKSFLNLYSNPAAIVIFIVAFILILICSSCLFVGLKHTFYKKVSIIAILKEGFSKTLWFLWTMISMQLVAWILGLFAGLIIVLSIFLGPLSIIVMVLTYIAIFSVFIFYIPIHFFSANNPFSSACYSFKTFWSNILSMIAFGIVFSIVGVAFSAVIMIIICMPIYMYLKGHYPDLPVEVLKFRFFLLCIPVAYLVLPYTMIWGWLNNLMPFVAYPELLNNEEEKTITIESADIHVDNQNNMNTPAFLDENNNMGLSQQQKPSHQNDRPYLNERIGNTLFEKFTSRNVDTPKTPDTPQTPDTSNNTEPKGE